MTSPKAGYSLVEALAALAIAAACLAALVDVQTQLVKAERQRLDRVAAADLEHAGLALLHDVNPAAEPRGWRVVGGGTRLTWTSRLVAPMRRQTAGLADYGGFDVALYRIDARVLDARGVLRHAFSVDQVGWRRSGIGGYPADGTL